MRKKKPFSDLGKFESNSFPERNSINCTRKRKGDNINHRKSCHNENENQLKPW